MEIQAKIQNLEELGWINHPPAYPTTLTETTLNANPTNFVLILMKKGMEVIDKK